MPSRLIFLEQYKCADKVSRFQGDAFDQITGLAGDLKMHAPALG